MLSIQQLEAWHTQWMTYLTQRKRSETTIRTCDTIINAFLAWIRTQPPSILHDDLTVVVLDDYVLYLRDDRVRLKTARQGHIMPDGEPTPLAHTTIRTYIGVLTRWLQWLIDRGKLAAIYDTDGTPLQPTALRDILDRLLDHRASLVAPRMPNLQRLPAYYDTQLTTFLAEHGIPHSCTGPRTRTYFNLLRDRALLAVLFATGGRIAEVLSIRVDQVLQPDGIAYRVHIRGKGRKRRALRFDELAQAWVQDYLEARATAYPAATALFISHGPKANGKQLSPVSAWRSVKVAAHWLADQRRQEGAHADEVTKLHAISPHSLRHFLAQYLLDEGAEYKDIAALLGHSSTIVTEQVYARQDEDQTLEIADTHAPRAILTTRSSSRE